MTPPTPTTPNVKVVNMQLEPVPVVRAPRELVQRVKLVVPQNTRESQETMYTVPAGKRLVIEHVGAQGQLESGVDEVVVCVVARLPDGGGAAWVPLTKHGWFAGRGTMFVGAALARIYCSPPPNDVYCRVILNETGSGRFEVSFTGYLIDA